METIMYTNSESVLQESTLDDNAAEDLVLRILREAGAPLYLDQIFVSRNGDGERASHSVIREAAWRLIRRGAVELTEDRKLKADS